jgi:hypothetical protein
LQQSRGWTYKLILRCKIIICVKWCAWASSQIRSAAQTVRCDWASNSKAASRTLVTIHSSNCYTGSIHPIRDAYLCTPPQLTPQPPRASPKVVLAHIEAERHHAAQRAFYDCQGTLASGRTETAAPLAAASNEQACQPAPPCARTPCPPQYFGQSGAPQMALKAVSCALPKVASAGAPQITQPSPRTCVDHHSRTCARPQHTGSRLAAAERSVGRLRGNSLYSARRPLWQDAEWARV